MLAEKKIDFVCVGVRRAGTTWLHRRLNEYKEISLTDKKEYGFFEIADEHDLQKEIITTFDTSGKTQDCLLGEINPSYYLDEKTLKRIKDHNPKTKIIYLVREPFGKVLSEKKYFTNRYGPGYFLSQNDTRYTDICDHIRYDYYYKILLKYFDEGNIKILFYREIECAPEKMVREVLDFIGLESVPLITETLSDRVNSSKKATAIPTFDFLVLRIKKQLDDSRFGKVIVRAMKRLGIVRVVAYLRKVNLKIGTNFQKKQGISLTEDEIAKVKKVIQSDIKKFAEVDSRVKRYWFNKTS